MPVGMRQWNPATNQLILDTSTDTINRLVGRVSLPEAAGSLSDDRLLAGTPFQCMTPAATYNQTPPKTFSFSGNTLNWSAGPACNILYGVGAGLSTYKPVTNGTRPGFRCYTPDGSAIVLDESMFALQLIGKGTRV